MSEKPFMPEKPFMNVNDVDYIEGGDGGKFEPRYGPVGDNIGSQKLGYGVILLAPGKASWPYHFHHVNEEMFLILEGEGTLRQAGKEYPVRRGDVICSPPGPDAPHQIRNTSDQDLKYLAVSTMESPEVAEYPDSGKYAVFCGKAPRANSAPGDVSFRIIAKKDAGVDYFEGES